MLKKRILCLVLCFSVFVSCAFYKPRQSYAFAATATVAGLALTLAAACGITFSTVDTGLIDDTINDFLKSNPEQESFLAELLSLKLDPVSGAVSIGFEYKDQLLSFFNSVFNYFDIDGDVVLPSSNPFSFLPSSLSVASLQSIPSFPLGDSYNGFFPFCRMRITDTGSGDNDYVVFSFQYPKKQTDTTYLMRNYYIRFYNDGTISDYETSYINASTFTYDSTDTRFPYFSIVDDEFYFYYPFPNKDGYNYSLDTSLSSFYFLDGVSISGDDVSNFDLERISSVYNDNYSYIISRVSALDIFVPSGTSSDYSFVYPADVTSDTIITAWDNALSGDTSSDVIVYPLTPDELVGFNGYDVAYGNEGVAGAVEGVDLPQGAVENPDIPVTPDLSGITGLLNKILSFLKSIPATLIGTKALDFSGFSNISLFDKFPFCIPFDLVNAVNQLNAPPEAPVFKVDFKGTIMESAGSIEIDMSNFEQLAKILRFFEFFGFVAGLIVVTRNLIRG